MDKEGILDNQETTSKNIKDILKETFKIDGQASQKRNFVNKAINKMDNFSKSSFDRIDLNASQSNAYTLG